MNKLLLLLVLIFAACGSKKNVPKPIKKPFELGMELTGTVTKIDSVESYYLINVRDENKWFRIVSKKSSSKPYNGTKLQNGNTYFFKLRQITDRSVNPRVANYLDIATCRYFENTEICTESAYELATAYNLLGLYLKPE